MTWLLSLPIASRAPCVSAKGVSTAFEVGRVGVEGISVGGAPGGSGGREECGAKRGAGEGDGDGDRDGGCAVFTEEDTPP